MIKLVREAESKGFCEVARDEEEAVKILAGTPVLNKLGVIVKQQSENQEKKVRIIWDLRESGVN